MWGQIINLAGALLQRSDSFLYRRMSHKKAMPPRNLLPFERIVDPHMRRRIFGGRHGSIVLRYFLERAYQALRIAREEYSRSVRERLAAARNRKLDQHHADRGEDRKHDCREEKYLLRFPLVIPPTAAESAPEYRAEKNVGD